MISYAQNFEDVMIARLFDRDHGTFVDVGANFPVQDNVTFHFYQRGWRGINVEPQAQRQTELNRRRPEDINVAALAGAVEGTTTFYEFDDPHHGLSTIDPAIAERHRLAGFTCSERQVEILRLDTILDRHLGDRSIDFLSIDAEGAEPLVLSGIDLSRRRPTLILIEAMAPTQQIDISAPAEIVLRAAGYVPVYCDGLNRFFLPAEHIALAERFRYPPNVFDGFRRLREVKAEREAKAAEARIADLERALAELKGVPQAGSAGNVAAA